MLDHRRLIYIFHGCHIEDPFPGWLDNFYNLDRHVIQDGHSWDDSDAEACAHKTGDCLVFFQCEVTLGAAAAFFKQLVDDGL